MATEDVTIQIVSTAVQNDTDAHSQEAGEGKIMAVQDGTEVMRWMGL